MAETTNQKTLTNVVLIIKNGTATGWANTSYRLAKGELGIAYLDNGNVLVKAGIDGNTPWADLPQVEGVFENDLTLTYAFGKYEPDETGSFTLSAAGKTMSEVMLDAFAEEVFSGLITGYPTATMGISGGNTSSEVGNKYGNDITVTLTLNPAGSYKYGAKDASGNKEQTDIAFTVANLRQGNTTATPLKTISDVSNNKLTYTLDVSENILTDVASSYTFYGNATYGADANRPLTNLGNFYKTVDGKPVATKVFSEAEGHIPGKEVLKVSDNGAKKSVSYQGYRKMFVGNTSAAVLDSAVIRGLSLKKDSGRKNGVEASTTQFEITAPEGATNLVIACPTNSKGKKYTLSEVLMFSAGVWDTYTSKFEAQKNGDAAIQVADSRGGTNNLQNYNVYMWKFAPLNGDTKFKIKLAAANV